MPKLTLHALAVGALVGAAGIPAHAMVCNIVYDRNDQVIYRDVTPPLDLSDRGSSAQAAMRQRGEYLMVIDTDRCARIIPSTASSGAASVDDIVAGMRPYMGRGGGAAASGGTAAGGAGSSVRAAAPAAAAAPSSARSGTTRASY